MSNAILGENCNLGQNVFVASDVVLGNNVKVQNNVSIYTGVTCDDDVFLGPSMVFTNVINPRSAINRRGQYTRTHVGKGATIGANATIVCGHNIGQYAFIGAGAVVTKNIPNYALVIGNPAKQIGWMSAYGHRLEFDENGLAACPESGEQYTLKENNCYRNTEIQSLKLEEPIMNYEHKNYQSIPSHLNEIGTKIIGAAIAVHKELGPGLLEKIYEVCFCHELGKRGLQYQRQVSFPIKYDNIEFEEGLRLDVLIEDQIICELKAVDLPNPVWEAQVISHLKLLDKPLGYLINFNVPLLKQGIHRFANGKRI